MSPLPLRVLTCVDSYAHTHALSCRRTQSGVEGYLLVLGAPSIAFSGWALTSLRFSRFDEDVDLGDSFMVRLPFPSPSFSCVFQVPLNPNAF